MKGASPRKVAEPRSTGVLHIYDRSNPKSGCFCCSPGDVVSVIAPRWAVYMRQEYLCETCTELAQLACL